MIRILLIGQDRATAQRLGLHGWTDHPVQFSCDRADGSGDGGKFPRLAISLELKDLKRQDGGVYVCQATNGVGQAAEATITVDVKCELLRER